MRISVREVNDLQINNNFALLVGGNSEIDDLKVDDSDGYVGRNGGRRSLPLPCGEVGTGRPSIACRSGGNCACWSRSFCARWSRSIGACWSRSIGACWSCSNDTCRSGRSWKSRSVTSRWDGGRWWRHSPKQISRDILFAPLLPCKVELDPQGAQDIQLPVGQRRSEKSSFRTEPLRGAVIA